MKSGLININKILIFLIVIVTTLSSLPSQGEVDVPPFINYQTDDGSSYPVITYYSTSNELSCLEYAEAGQKYLKICDNNAKRKKTFKLKNLSQNTLYSYSIDNAHIGSFKTASRHFKPFKIVAIGHTGGTQPVDSYPKPLLENFLMNFNPDLFIHTGDVVWGPSYDNYKDFIFDFKNILSKTPLMITPGNHDIDWPYGKVGNNNIEFKNFFSFPLDGKTGNGKTYYFTYNDVLFISLAYHNEDYSPGTQNYKWLNNALAHKSKYKIVFLGGGQYYWQKEKNIRNTFPLLKEKGVDIILAGDSTGVEYKHISGIPYIFTGSRGEKEFPVAYIDIQRDYIKIKQLSLNKEFNSDVYFKNTDKKIDYLFINSEYEIGKNKKDYSVPITDMTENNSNFIIKVKAINTKSGVLNLNTEKYASSVRLHKTDGINNFYFSIPYRNLTQLDFSLDVNADNLNGSFIVKSINVYRYSNNDFNVKSIKLSNPEIHYGENVLEFKFENKGSYPIETVGKYTTIFSYKIMDKNKSKTYTSKRITFPQERQNPNNTWIQDIKIMIPEHLKKGEYTYVLNAKHNIKSKTNFSLSEIYSETFYYNGSIE